MSASDFCNWLEGLLRGDDAQRAVLSRPTSVLHAEELVNGELRPSMIVEFPGGSFVLTVKRVAE